MESIPREEASVYIRPLRHEDAHVSYHWRNDPRIWRFTGSRPDRHITYEIEAEWIDTVLKRENEKRFAICISGTDEYVGNVFLTDISGKEAHVHIFIGEMKFWGGGRAMDAIRLCCAYGFDNLGLDVIYAEINKQNNSSLALAKVSGFIVIDEYPDEKRKMTLTKLSLSREAFENNHPQKQTT